MNKKLLKFSWKKAATLATAVVVLAASAGIWVHLSRDKEHITLPTADITNTPANGPLMRPPVDISGMPVSETHVSYSINVGDVTEVAGFFDYVFVARVVSLDGTEYRWPVTVEGGRTVYMPYTHYTIEVLENIKGELRLGEVPFLKGGGLLYDQDIVEVADGDVMPEVDGIYVFYANSDENGVIGSGGAHGNLLLTEADNVHVWLGKNVVKNEDGIDVPAPKDPNIPLETIHGLSYYKEAVYGVENQKEIEKSAHYVAEHDVANEAVKDT
ncbi:MAG: hypothetical protein LBO63_02180 [Oscillospiraceae bacterium]|jgi:hypothetical protein|nr:hypothetical protein [Oscillospiraceae bacterium]